MRRTTLGFLCCGALLSGCSKVTSEGLSTAEMYADLHAVQIQPGTVVAQGRLHKGSVNSSTYVELHDGDDLIASIAQPYGGLSISGDLFGQLQEATRSYRMMTGGPQQSSSDLFFPDYANVYEVTLPLPDAAQPIYIGLHRDSQTSAPDSLAILPPPFELLSPQPGETHAADSDLIVTWSSAVFGFETQLITNSRCADGSMSVSAQSIVQNQDTGTATIPGASLRPSSSTGSCNVTVSVDRWTSGTLDGNFAGGSIRGHQVRTAKITVP